MRALTIWQPWAWLIVVGVKTVENRSWSAHLSEPFAIHAGMRDDRPAYHDPDVAAAVEGMPPLAEWPHGAILAMARFSAAPHPESGGCCRPWGRTGQYHWPLTITQVLDEPVRCRGWQQLWTVPDDVAALVERQLTRAGSR